MSGFLELLLRPYIIIEGYWFCFWVLNWIWDWESGFEEFLGGNFGDERFCMEVFVGSFWLRELWIFYFGYF